MNDVSLSTAAHNSARFPLISPPGAVRNRQNQVIDRIVDGGYIDNYGALTALELAQAIHAIEPKLAPFVLAVSNDPDEDPDLNPLDAPDGAFLSDIMVPVKAIMSARSGHGRLAMGQVEAILDHLAETGLRGADSPCASMAAIRLHEWRREDIATGVDELVAVDSHPDLSSPADRTGPQPKSEPVPIWVRSGPPSTSLQAVPAGRRRNRRSNSRA